ncbi:hypothetical protein L593_01265 [Salinarchaeum sp. Harcht-Bsk1]|uniref:DUF5813 family protein n=1 Tax=Salinarchaeum sp. Harcht-Bsk1 TaxID=1333523 RepID=UPI00034230F4|nr:DUF5813 family protein [Salinarchaeum sp. Harcht-Bsk1]AGN00206.1 hypothetical protein L593_01265 [Salinarchaeum sp. Harcht-Bsk1]
MNDESNDAAGRAFDANPAFERSADGYAVTTTPFEATVRAESIDHEGRDARFHVEVTMPSLDAAVADERVGDVVQDGWFETLALRLEDAYDVAEVDAASDPEIALRDSTVEARFSFLAWNADTGVADAKAIVDFAEGTYVQGVVPGYQYDDPVAGLIDRATQQAGSEDSGAKRGGTPL